MEKVLEIALYRFFQDKKTLNKKTPDHQLHFVHLRVHG